MPEYRARTIDAPANEWMDAAQAAAFLGLEQIEFLERVSLQVFPSGSPSNLRADQWHWQTVMAMSWMRPWLDTIYVERKRHSLEKRAERRRKKATKNKSEPFSG